MHPLPTRRLVNRTPFSLRPGHIIDITEWRNSNNHAWATGRFCGNAAVQKGPNHADGFPDDKTLCETRPSPAGTDRSITLDDLGNN